MIKRTNWTKGEIKDLLLRNDRMVIKSLLKLCEYQTDYELERKEANVRNHLGFNKFDAPILTNVANVYTKTGQISRRSFADTRRRLLKYSSQLAKIANGVI